MTVAWLAARLREDLSREVATRAFAAAPRIPLAVRARTKEGLLVRFSHHGIYQDTFQDMASFEVECPTRDGFEREEATDASPEGVRSAVERLLARARPVARAPARPTVCRYRPVRDAFALALGRLPDMAARCVGEAASRLREGGASATGYFSAFRRSFFVATAAGARALHAMTSVRFGVTARRGGGRGYATLFTANPRMLRAEQVCDEALWLAGETSRREVSLAAGEYDCLFSPRAFQEFLSSLAKHFDARQYHSGQSVLARRLHRRVAAPAFSLIDSVYQPGQSGLPFDAEGVARKAVTLISKGVLTGLLAGSGLDCRCHARPTGHTARGILEEEDVFPLNLVVAGGARPWRQMLASIKRGVFINKIWYHQLVHERDLVVTGTATAGTSWVEGGRLVGRLSRVRYHDSLMRVLAVVAEVSRERQLLKDGEYGASLLPFVLVRGLRLEPA